MNEFLHTRKEVAALTGYTSQWVKIMSVGGKQMQAGTEYPIAPILAEGVDWVRYNNRAVFYSAGAVVKLLERKILIDCPPVSQQVKGQYKSTTGGTWTRVT